MLPACVLKIRQAVPHAHIVRFLSFFLSISSFLFTCRSVTENGFAVKDEDAMPLEQALLDHDRVQYFRGTTSALLAAIHEDGVDIRAYFPWSKSYLCLALRV